MKIGIMILTGLLAGGAFAQNNQNSQNTQTAQPIQPVEVMEQSEFETQSDSNAYQKQTTEQIGKREEVQMQEQNVGAQLQQARENVKIDEKNIERAKAKKKDSEAQVDIDKASIDKYEAQLQEDKAQVKKLEERTGSEKKKKGFFD